MNSCLLFLPLLRFYTMLRSKAVLLRVFIFAMLFFISVNIIFTVFEDDTPIADESTASRRISYKVPTAGKDNDMDDGDYYSSMYCVAHRLRDPLNAKSSYDNDSGDKPRLDVIVNGMFMPNNSYRGTADDDDITGLMSNYHFAIHNRTCLYNYVYFNKMRVKFYIFLRDTPKHRQLLSEKKLNLPPVSISSRPLEVTPKRLREVGKKSQWAFSFTPSIVLGKRPRDSVGEIGNQEEIKQDTLERDGIPTSAPYNDYIVAYFVPTVAPWNFAHTLLCDLFGFFWGYVELDNAFSRRFPDAMTFLRTRLSDAQPLATSFMYFPKFPLPNSNKAFEYIFRRQPMYDITLPSGVYCGLLVGTGTKSWSWVTTDYSASGSPALWYAFRQYIIRLTGAQQPTERRDLTFSRPQRTIRVSICYKRDKRGIANSQKILEALQRRFNTTSDVFGNVEFVLESVVGHSARRQVEMMLAADVFVCNEGTLGTTFFMMNPGTVFLPIPLVYHSPHLHRRDMPSPDKWWMFPDLVRGDPRFNTGGNIDWFPPAIPWIRVAWYDEIRLDEVKIQQPLRGLRNYMPDFNVELNPERFIALMERALTFVRSEGTVWSVAPCHLNSLTTIERTKGIGFYNFSMSISSHPSPNVFDLRNEYISLCVVPINGINVLRNITLREVFYFHEFAEERMRFLGRTHRPPNYSITADQCRRLLHLRPSLATSFNTAYCHYGMSWLCEFFANGRYMWRFFHDKWQQSRGRCGGVESWPGHWRGNPQYLRDEVLKKSFGASHDLGDPNDYFFDVRESRNLSHFRFFSKEAMEKGYTSTDLGRSFTPDAELVRRIFV